MQFRAIRVVGLSLVSLLWAGAARAEEPAATPEAAVARPAVATDELPPSGAKATHIVAGAATTVIAYGLAFGASYLVQEDDFRGSKDLRIPIAGPWLALGRTACPASTPDCSKVPLVLGALLTIMDGVVQAGGLAIIGEGLFLKTSSGVTRPQRKVPQAKLMAVPFNFDRDGVGLGVVGTF